MGLLRTLLLVLLAPLLQGVHHVAEAARGLGASHRQQPKYQPHARYSSVYALLRSRPELSLTRRAVEVAGLREAWGEWDTHITAFIPTDTAWLRLFASLNTTDNKMLSDQTALANLLAYHVLQPGRVVRSHGMAPGAQLITALDARPLACSWDIIDRLRLTDIAGRTATVVDADVRAGRSLVHVVDAVLLPVRLDDL